MSAERHVVNLHSDVKNLNIFCLLNNTKPYTFCDQSDFLHLVLNYALGARGKHVADVFNVLIEEADFYLSFQFCVMKPTRLCRQNVGNFV